MEGEGGYFRRNHLVPVPQVRDLAELNQTLLSACQADAERIIGDRTEPTGVLMTREREYLRLLPKHGFDLAEVSFPTVDNGGCVTVSGLLYIAFYGVRHHCGIMLAFRTQG